MFMLTALSHLHAGSFTITTDASSIIEHKKIVIAYTRDIAEQGILSTSLCFTIDQPSVCLKRWKSSQRSHRVWNMFAQKKRSLFTGGQFTLECDFEENADSALLISSLHTATVSLSCLIMGEDGALHPYTQVMRVGEQHDVCVQEPLPEPEIEQIVPGKTHRIVSLDDSALIESFGATWYRMQAFVMSFLTVSHAFWGVIVLSILVALAWLRRRFRFVQRIIPSLGRWERECIGGIVFLSGCCVIGCIALCGAYIVSLLLFSVWCLIGMGYAFATPPDNEIFLGRLKKLVGFCLGVSVLPLAFKALLVYHGF